MTRMISGDPRNQWHASYRGVSPLHIGLKYLGAQRRLAAMRGQADRGELMAIGDQSPSRP
jgi:hypothetical protein